MYPPIKYEGEFKTVSHLQPDLAVGGFVHAPKLIEDGWICISLAKASPELPAPSVRIPLIDGKGNDRADLQRVIAWIVNRWKEGKRVAILCRSGANRSPAAAAAALFVAGRASSVYGAIEWMRGKRREVGHYRDTTSEFEFAAQDMVTIQMKEQFHNV